MFTTPVNCQRFAINDGTGKFQAVVAQVDSVEVRKKTAKRYTALGTVEGRII